MTEVSNTTDSNTKITYAFRFDQSDKNVHLTQEELDCFPYLNTLITHEDDFLSIRNENGEYVLSDPVKYTWFVSVLGAVTTNHPYTLFSELPEHENVLDTLRLMDYLGVQSFPLPLLQYESLVLSNPTDIGWKNESIQYDRVTTVSEVRRTAAEFVLALANNEYQLCHSNTRGSIFNLVSIILFNSAVFNSRFRYHTLSVVKKRCYSFFSKCQQRKLRTAYRITQYRNSHSSPYLSDNQTVCPTKLNNSFGWKGTRVPINHLPNDVKIRSNVEFISICPRSSFYERFAYPSEEIWSRGYHQSENSLPVMRNSSRLIHYLSRIDWTLEEDIFLCNFSSRSEQITLLSNDKDEKISIDEMKRDRRKEEAQSARSGRFNTLTKRPMIDKFKYQYNPKPHEYR